MKTPLPFLKYLKILNNNFRLSFQALDILLQQGKLDGLLDYTELKESWDEAINSLK